MANKQEHVMDCRDKGNKTHYKSFGSFPIYSQWKSEGKIKINL